MKLPIAMNRRWIRGLHEGLGSLDEGDRLKIMKPAAFQCSSDIWKLCEQFLGKDIESVDDLTEGWNLLRADRGLVGSWVKEGGLFKGVFSECGCPLVRSGLIELHPVQCRCSQSMMEQIFSRAAKRDASVKLERSIARGDKVCEFIIGFN